VKELATPALSTIKEFKRLKVFKEINNKKILKSKECFKPINRIN